MAKFDKFAKTVNLPRSWWSQLGADVSDGIRVHTTIGRKDNKGRRFKSLSDRPLVDKKGRVIFEGYATRKRKGEAGRRAGAQPGVANLHLTGDMMNNLQTRGVTNESVTIGWDSDQAEKLEWNEKNGRVVTDAKHAVAPGIEKYIQTQVDKQTNKNIKKNNVVNRIRLG